MNSLWRRNIPILINRVISQQLCKRALQSSSIVSVNSNKQISLIPVNHSYNTVRHKSKKRNQDDSDDEQDIFEGDSSLAKDSKVVKFNTTSLRTDAVLKSALGVARNKIEQLFYESKIRVNGNKLLKKSAAVKIGHEIDIIKNVSPKNPDHLYVARVEVLNITAKEDNIVFTVRRFKNLLIENYETDPHRQESDINEQ